MRKKSVCLSAILALLIYITQTGFTASALAEPTIAKTTAANAVSGRILTAAEAGDTRDWIEVARNGNYCLLVRSYRITTVTVEKVTPYDSAESARRNTVNGWFNGAEPDSIPFDSKLRQYSVKNDSLYNLGFYADTANGFSSPTGEYAATGDDVAFLLSFAEAMSFLGKTYDTGSGSNIRGCDSIAIANFDKLWNIGDGSDKAHTALRTQNYNGMGTIAFNHMGWVGNVGQYNMAPNTYFTVYLHPAIWVHASIFGGFPATDSTDLVIAKLLTIPKGTIVPKAEFTFVFRPKGFVSAGDNMETHLDGTHPGKPDMPVIVDQFISYDPKNQDYVVIPGDNALYLVKESTDILGGFSHTNWILGEGIYKYQVEELPGGIELTGDDNEFESYSDALYDIEISVFKDENGLLYAQYYTMKTVSGHIDEYFLGSSGGEKADPIIFTNKYELNKEKKPPTGIITDNLPYLVLAVVSIIGFIAYVGIRKMRMMNGVNK